MIKGMIFKTEKISQKRNSQALLQCSCTSSMSYCVSIEDVFPILQYDFPCSKLEIDREDGLYSRIMRSFCVKTLILHHQKLGTRGQTVIRRRRKGNGECDYVALSFEKDNDRQTDRLMDLWIRYPNQL